MYDFTLTMALVDFIPVLFFAVSAVLMMQDFYAGMPRYNFALLAAGTINVFLAGFLKAVWKLLYAANICDFHALCTLFLPTQSLGFLMAGVAMVVLVCQKKNSTVALAAPPLFSGTAVFLVMMVLGLGCICACLSVLAARHKRKIAILYFVLAFLLSMGMGYIGRLDSTAAWVNWLEQGINIGSQLCLMVGMVILHKAINADARKERFL